MGKRFILETDHANLVWMEKSTVPKIIRWRMYLQSFEFLIRHIPGKQNIIADWFSRLYHSYTPFQLQSLLTLSASSSSHLVDPTYHCHQLHMLDYIIQQHGHHIFPMYTIDTTAPLLQFFSNLNASNLFQLSPDQALKAVHNSKMGHHGIHRTYNLLNKHFPGHKIPLKLITDYIHACPACQKHRLQHVPLPPINRVLPHAHQRSTLGIDLLTVTPESDGHKYLVVIYNLFTKFVTLYPTRERQLRV